MKILHINGLGHFGGAENFAYLIAKEQVKRGNDVTIVYTTEKSVYGALAEKAGIKTKEFNMRSGYDIINFKKYVDFIKKENPNIIHDHNGTNLVRLSKFFLKNVVFIQHVHGTKLGNIVWEKRNVLLWKKLTSYFVDYWIANSEHTKNIAIRKELIPVSRISVIHNGIDISKFNLTIGNIGQNIKREFGITETDFVIGTVGKLTYSKRMDRILEIAEAVDGKFIIVGDGELKEKLECKRDKMGLKSRVFFTGSTGNVENMLSMFDVFVLTSEWEAFGISLLEAMAMGLPVIAFSVDGIPEVVGECGILIPPGDIDGMKKAITDMKKNKALRLKLKQCGIKRVKDKFDISLITEKLNKLYSVPR